MVVQTTAIPGEDDPLDELDLESEPQPPRKTNVRVGQSFFGVLETKVTCIHDTGCW